MNWVGVFLAAQHLAYHAHERPPADESIESPFVADYQKSFGEKEAPTKVSLHSSWVIDVMTQVITRLLQSLFLFHLVDSLHQSLGSTLNRESMK
jgi:hypothetical protein